MICLGCNEERKPSDFLGKEKCYKCIYKEKYNIVEKKKFKCVICEKILPLGRRKFCSDDCANESMKRHTRNYWTRNITIDVIQWN